MPNVTVADFIQFIMNQLSWFIFLTQWKLHREQGISFIFVAEYVTKYLYKQTFSILIHTAVQENRNEKHPVLGQNAAVRDTDSRGSRTLSITKCNTSFI